MSERKLYVYVDIDDTIVRSVGSKRIPIPQTIEHVRRLNKEGAILYCWSSGGAEYAKASALEFGIADCFEAFLPKPNVLVDDQKMADWPRFVHVHPSGCSNNSIDDYLRALEK